MKNITRTILFTCFFTAILVSLPAQEKLPSGEYFTALTDRDTYIAGENIYFTGRQITDTAFSFPSTVLYADLLSPSGQVVKSGKFSIDGKYSQGSLTIPEDIPSGTYYLRFYSKWLMNFSARAMQYYTIIIINPDMAATIPPHGETQRDISDLSMERHHHNSAEDYKIELALMNYNKREDVKFKVSSSSQSDILLHVSVFPAGSSNLQMKIPPIYETISAGQVYHLPEVKGITLTGILQHDTKEALKNEVVYLTIFGNKEGFFPTHTTSGGRFQYTLPDFSGMHEVFLTAKHNGATLQIDSDVHPDIIKLPYVPLKADSSESARWLTMSRQHQLFKDYFGDADTLMIDSTLINHTAFYGKPYKSVEIENFIDLPTLHDYFIELLPEVQINKSDDNLRLTISGPSAENYVIEPLVLIDGIALTNINALLDIDPKRIKKIELVNMPWIRGDNMFGGILSLTSVKGDFAGVDLPETSSFFNYKLYAEEKHFPQYYTPVQAYIPDVRNTLYWNPSLLVKPGMKKETAFKTGDLPGKYIIRVSKIDEKGKIFSQDLSFIIEE